MITIHDNGGRSIDRYTVNIDGQVWGLSENADQPNGFCQWAGEANDLILDDPILAEYEGNDVFVQHVKMFKTVVPPGVVKQILFLLAKWEE